MTGDHRQLLAQAAHAAFPIAAIALALGYQGADLTYLALSQALLVVWAACLLARGGPGGVPIPSTAPAIALTLLWVWLGTSALWSRVPYLSVLEFWTLGSVPLLFWLYHLTPDRESLWRAARVGLAGIGLALATLAYYQRFALGERPTSLFLHPHAHTAFLNLLALAMAGHFLSGLAQKRRPTLCDGLWGSVMGVLFFAIALGAGRGATLGFGLGLAALVIMAAGASPRRYRLLLAGMALAAFAAANLSVPGGVIGKLRWVPEQGAVAEAARAIDGPGTSEPAPVSESVSQRLLLWRATLDLLDEAPWYGIGGGTYWLAIPPYRHPLETTDGFYAHNDYLQALVELGWPGLGLILAVIGLTAGMVMRAHRQSRLTGSSRCEAAGLCAALIAVSSHSLVSFNFHILAILSVSGLLLARLHDLCTPRSPPSWVLRRPSWVRPRAYALGVCLLALVPLSYLSGVALTEHFYARGAHQAAQGRLEAADASLRRAGRLLESDRPRVRRAALHTGLLRAHPELGSEARRRLFEAASAVLDQAQRINPLRPQIHVERARLHETVRSLAGADWRRQVDSAYRAAIDLNPRLLEARRRYAEFLAAEGRHREALDVLAAGLRARPTAAPAALPYYALMVRLHLTAGEETQAAEAFATMQHIMSRHGIGEDALKPLGLEAWLPALRAFGT